MVRPCPRIQANISLNAELRPYTAPAICFGASHHAKGETMQSEQVNLHRQLRQFGLNPQEWILEREGFNQYVLRNRLDREIYFKGLAKRTLSCLKWRALELIL
jgi:hypothetical protein